MEDDALVPDFSEKPLNLAPGASTELNNVNARVAVLEQLCFSSHLAEEEVSMLARLLGRREVQNRLGVELVPMIPSPSPIPSIATSNRAHQNVTDVGDTTSAEATDPPPVSAETIRHRGHRQHTAPPAEIESISDRLSVDLSSTPSLHLRTDGSEK